jgi:hypothetical protein
MAFNTKFLTLLAQLDGHVTSVELTHRSGSRWLDMALALFRDADLPPPHRPVSFNYTVQYPLARQTAATPSQPSSPTPQASAPLPPPTNPNWVKVWEKFPIEGFHNQLDVDVAHVASAPEGHVIAYYRVTYTGIEYPVGTPFLFVGINRMDIDCRNKNERFLTWAYRVPSLAQERRYSLRKQPIIPTGAGSMSVTRSMVIFPPLRIVCHQPISQGRNLAAFQEGQLSEADAGKEGGGGAWRGSGWRGEGKCYRGSIQWKAIGLGGCRLPH